AIAARTSLRWTELTSGTSSPGWKHSGEAQQQPCQLWLAGKLPQRRRPRRLIQVVVAGQGGKPCLDVRGDEVAHLAIDLVHPFHGSEEAAGRFVELPVASLEGARDLLPAVGAGDDSLEIEAGKRLPLAVGHGKHLPQVRAQRCVCSHYYC